MQRPHQQYVSLFFSPSLLTHADITVNSFSKWHDVHQTKYSKVLTRKDVGRDPGYKSHGQKRNEAV